jgi:hypothetical protein
MHTSRSAITPLLANLRLSRKDCPTPCLEGDHMKSVPYAPVVSSLMYVMVNACGWRHQQIHAQSRPTTLECSEAYLQISGWHTRLWHQIQTERTLWPSWLHWLELRGLSRQPEIDVRILLQVRVRRHFVEIETTWLYSYKYDRSRVRSCIARSKGNVLARTISLYVSTS